MDKSVSKGIVSYALAASLMLSGCGEKSECDIPTRHVHRYTKEITEDISIEKYIDNEHLKVKGYNWTDNYFEITSEDEKLYHIIDDLFDGVSNWNYLYYVMSCQKDYLKFYYEYDTIETYTTTDSDGKVTTHTRTVHHDGWTTNPNRSDNTGKTRLYHHKFYGYRVIYNNGIYKLEKSPLVDDIREIIFEYPYFSEKCVSLVYEQFKFKRSELKNLSVDDFDTFNHPDLTNASLYYAKTKVR